MKWHRLAPALLALGVAAQAACPNRQTCETHEDCPEGRFCVTDENEGLAQCGAPCAADLGCPAGQACMLRDDGSLEGACLVLLDDLAVGEDCSSDRDCASGACEGATAPICVDQGTDDLSCEDAALRCILDGVRRVCVPPTDELEAGAPCTDPRQCLAGTCIDPPDAADGEPRPPVCADNCSEAADCPREGDACVRLVGGARACLEPLADGMSCQASSACAGGFCLEDIDGSHRCASACVDEACAEGFVCVSDTESNRVCMPQLETRSAGEACDSSRQCASGYCAHFKAGEEELGTLCADPCSDSGTCEGGLVCWVDDSEGGTDLCGPVPSQ
ncbi:MAG: hypothetical protein IT382_07675 [Deltaproteobacteria bacterium]|nr:hypothetical protein [Deltaproteobacteria bacterium]